jgi:hypothetical protein
MIQRLQTLWLLFAAILAFATFNISFFSGYLIVDDVKQFQRFTAMSNIFLMICTSYRMRWFFGNDFLIQEQGPAIQSNPDTLCIINT